MYKHFGKDIIAQQTPLAVDSPDMERIHQKIYRDFIEAFDANDNGISAYDTAALEPHGIKKRFNDNGFSIASVVNRYNYAPLSHAELASIAKQGLPEAAQQDPQADEDAKFLLASAFTGLQFESEVRDTVSSWLPAYSLVSQAFGERQTYDASGRILALPYRKEGLPWRDHLDGLEAEANVLEQVLYALFPESGEANCKWRIRAVGKSKEGFENRKSLPEAWRGVRDEDLDKVSGIPGCVFVHAGGFIGGNKSFDGVLQMAQKACEIK